MTDEPSKSRPRGRPPVDDPMSHVSTRLPTMEHDRLVKLAKLRDQSVAETVRQLLLRNLRQFPS